MLYAIAHFLRNKMPWLWDILDMLNSFLFNLHYGRDLKAFKFYTPHEGYEIVKLSDISTNKIVEFFDKQPEEAYTYFRPHDFDSKAVKKLQRNKAFLAYLLIDKSNDNIAAYFFIRSFFFGKGFRGRMVDMNYRGKSLGTMTNILLNEVGFGIGLRLFETVSKDNDASYRSAISASNFKVIKELPHNELYIEIEKD